MMKNHRAILRGILIIPLLLFKSSLNGAAAFGTSTSAPSSSDGRSLLANKRVCICGGGPCGLFLATLLIQREPAVQIIVLEKTQRGGKNVNAFGTGLGSRLLESLEAAPGLRKRVESVGAPSVMGTAIVSRADLSEQMTRFLEDSDMNRQVQILFGEGCADIDLNARKLTTTAGAIIEYDLLIGSDGINSMVRQTLVAERGVQEEHYLGPSRWKALRLPPQSDVESGSFMPLRHKLLRGGRVLPRHPEGHILLMFWDKESGVDNPGNVSTAEELKSLLTDAMQDEAQKKRDRIHRLFLGGGGDKEAVGKKRNIVFDDEAVDLFLQARPSRSHYMKIDRFHEDSVALVGDSAAGMFSLLGQGCACGLKSAEILAECLLGSSSADLNEALQSYSELAIPGAHAITEMNLVSVLLRGGPFVKALMIPLTLPQKLRGKLLFKRLNEPDVPYVQILKENRLLIALSRRRWRRDREPLERRT